MKGEMYVVKLIRNSERARSAVATILGVVEPESQLRKLKDPNVIQWLARKLNCQNSEVFERLSQYVWSVYDEQLPTQFTAEHLGRLVNRDGQIPLAKILRCTTEETLSKLFNPLELNNTLRKVGILRNGQLDTGLLLLTILSPQNVSAIEQMYGVRHNDWGIILNNERWLRLDAIEIFKDEAIRQSWPTTDPSRILAILLDKSLSQDILHSQDSHPAFDWLGLTYLRQRLQHVIIRLREQAVESAETAASLAPSRPALRRLPIWLEIYERGAIMNVLPYLVGPKKPLSAFIDSRDCDIFQQKGKPDVSKYLMIREVRRFPQNLPQRRFPFIVRKEFVTFDVFCSLQGLDQPQLVVRCHSVLVEIYEHLKEVIPKLIGADLSPMGNSIGERLLNTQVLVPDQFLQLLRESVSSLGATFIQSLIMCGTPLSNNIEIPWRDNLTQALPYQATALKADTEFSHDITGIVNILDREYRQQDRILEVVTDSVPRKNS